MISINLEILSSIKEVNILLITIFIFIISIHFDSELINKNIHDSTNFKNLKSFLFYNY